MKKVLLTATVQSHIVQFHKPLIELLHEYGYEVHVAARNNLAEKNGLKLDFVDRVYDIPFSRSPKSLDNLKAYSHIKRILKNEYYDVVHCNTPMAGIVTRLATRKTRKRGTRVVYTAHGFHFYKGAPIKNWILFYPIERIMAKYCDTLITITKEDYRLAKNQFPTNVEHIHGVGVYTDRYHPVPEEKQLLLRQMEGLKDSDFVILCTGELNKNKNQKTLILVAQKLRKETSDFVILLAGNGPTECSLKKQIKELGVEKHVRMLGYRTDLEKVTPSVDLVVSCSHREGLPLNIIEAMLCKKPVVVSSNRGHKELVKKGFNGFIFKADDIEGYTEAIKELVENKAERNSYGENGYRKAKRYTADFVKKELKAIYRLG